MPVSFLSSEQRENYGRYTGAPSAHDLARYFHLDDTDHALIQQKRGEHNRLGFAVQLGTARYLGIFLEDPLAVPAPVLHTLAKQLRIEEVDSVRAYSTGEQRWQHAAEIRQRYGYVEVTEHRVGFRLTRWLYALCWTGTDRPSVLFERAAAWLVTHKVLLPGCTTLERYIARLRSRVEERLWQALVNGIVSEQQARLENLLVVPSGSAQRSTRLLAHWPSDDQQPVAGASAAQAEYRTRVGYQAAGNSAHPAHPNCGPGPIRRCGQSQRNPAPAQSSAARYTGRLRPLPRSHRARRCFGSIRGSAARVVRRRHQGRQKGTPAHAQGSRPSGSDLGQRLPDGTRHHIVR